MYLLDTNALIWWLQEDKKLSNDAYSIIKKPNVAIYVSLVSIWEISIKQSIGKLTFDKDFDTALARERFILLPITYEHARAVKNIPWIHRDPFDRLLIAQAQNEGFVLITSDKQIKKYDVQTLQ